MRRPSSQIVVCAFAIALSLACLGPLAGVAGASPRVSIRWIKGFSAPGTPSRYDKVGIVAVGPGRAKNVLVLEPGTSAGGGYFVPLAKWIVTRAKGWQVWSVERRENLLDRPHVTFHRLRRSVRQAVRDERRRP